MYILTEYHMRSDNMSAENRLNSRSRKAPPLAYDPT